jgi:asparagine synthetase B (glutamine-hydrolysing)
MLGRDRPQRAFDQWWDPSFLGANSEPADPEAPSAGSRMDRALRWDSTCGPLQSLLRYGDRNSMAWSREVRQPFLDHRLAEYIVSLPDAFKVGEGVTKRVMRAAMKGIVPAVILNRHDKLGYQAPMGAWFAGSLRPWVFGKLEQARDELRGRLAGDLLERFSKLETIGEWSNGRHLMRLMTLAEGLHQLRSCLPPAHSMPKALA